MDSNAQAAAETERTANPAPDAAPQRAEASDAQVKADNRAETKTETKTDSASTGRDKPKAAEATQSNGEAAVATDDAPQPDATTTPGEAVKVILSGDALATVADAKPADDATKIADDADAATTTIPAIGANAASIVAVAVPVVPVTNTTVASPTADAATTVATIESTAAASAATANLSADASAATASANASLAASASDTPETATATADAKTTAAADQIALAKTAASQPVAGETLPADAELAANAAATNQVAVPVSGKAKAGSTAPTATTPTTKSADAEATDAPTTTPSLPGQTSDASAPKGAERIDAKQDKLGSSTDKPDAPTTEAKPAAAPTVTSPAEHRAPAVATHSISLDLNLPPVQTPPPQSFQAQTPNLVVNPAAQLNTTLANTPVPVSGLAVDIALRAAGGASRFEIRLDPAELGRIDVRLDVDRHGNVTSHLTVEKPATLDMLRRDAPQLQQALENAGLKTGDSGLQFSLRDQSTSGRNNDNGSERNSQRLIISEDDTVPAEVAGRTYGRALGSSSGVDIRV